MSAKSGSSSPSVRMRGFLSEWAGTDPGWPETYVVVETAPEHWMATVTLPDLADVLDRHPEARLRGVPYRWDGDRLVVMLGPVHVSGPEADWRRLGDDIVTSARSAGELYEAPSARPWPGPTSEISVREVEVSRNPSGFVEPDAPGDEVDADCLLADLCGLSREDLRDVLGTGWRPWKGSRGVAPYPLLLWGHPAQLAAELLPDDGVRIGRPAGSWPGPGELVMEAVDAVAIDRSTPRSELESLVRDVIRRRRRSFNWCRYCGGIFAPEERLERNVCSGCGTAVLGFIH